MPALVRENFDSAAAIAAENQFNEPAPPGSRFAVINYTITNGTEESVNTLFAVSVGMVGSANRQYDGANAFCEAVIPQPMSDGATCSPEGRSRATTASSSRSPKCSTGPCC